VIRFVRVIRVIRVIMTLLEVKASVCADPMVIVRRG
jgi:hypothetical protein